MKAIKFTLLAGALLTSSGIASAQPAGGRAAEVTRDQFVQRAEQRFARLDADRNGQLTMAEAREGMKGRMDRRQARRDDRQGDRAARAFARIDINGDGQISREEFAQRRALRGERGQRGAQRGGRMGRLFGADGVVTLAEYRAQALQRFERLDGNRDGRLSLAERQEARAKIRADRRARRGATGQN